MKYLKLSALSLLLILSVFACDSTRQPDDEVKNGFPEIILEDSVLNVGEDGGVFEVPYMLSFTLENGRIETNSPVDWITMADNGSSVTVAVASNEEKESRDALVTVEYWQGNSFVADSIYVYQDALSYDYRLAASDAVCEYYGDMLDRPGSPHNYYLMVSDLGWDAGNAKVYKFDIYISAPDNANRLSLPTGTYVLGEKGVPMNFSRDYSMYSVNNQSASESLSIAFTEGTLTVERQGSDYVLDAVLTDLNGDTHHMTYTGPVDFLDYYEPAPEYSSTLTDNLVADLGESILEVTYDGDYYGYGTYIWYLHIRNEDWTGDSFIIELCAPADNFDAGVPSGEYAVSPSGDAGTAIQGYPSYPFESGSWYYYYDEEAAKTGWAPLDSGKVTFTDNDDGTYTVKIDCMDDNPEDPHAIIGTWTGTATFYDATSDSSQYSGSRVGRR